MSKSTYVFSVLNTNYTCKMGDTKNCSREKSQADREEESRNERNSASFLVSRQGIRENFILWVTIANSQPKIE